MAQLESQLQEQHTQTQHRAAVQEGLQTRVTVGVNTLRIQAGAEFYHAPLKKENFMWSGGILVIWGRNGNKNFAIRVQDQSHSKYDKIMALTE